ncbi:Hypothetical Protein FCC1311_023352 [Hondaea fermentalgiana]|uniref:Uncharacterized protein n=1 Tax=Hondaea fermentalgiana TaxID=2315210 RepID=A0A2R5G6G3_9STRA|nr:Hypothetical Protein FCC1311_023352 [Hondaea fermentalgiana]|eukprot:GBG26115.1 Hypothetical Protein FCC1311_023352 [Hondaea fermentalgiana]
MAWLSSAFREQVVDDVSLCLFRFLNVLLFLGSVALLSLAIFFGFEEHGLTILEVLPLVTGFAILLLTCASILVHGDSGRVLLVVYLFVLRAMMALSVLTSIFFFILKRQIASSSDAPPQDLPRVVAQVRGVALFFLALSVVLGLDLAVTKRVYGTKLRTKGEYAPAKPLTSGKRRPDLEYGSLEDVYGNGSTAQSAARNGMDRDREQHSALLDNSLNSGAGRRAENGMYGPFSDEEDEEDEHAIRNKYAALYEKYKL